jgi:YD repeat-containing protein
VSNQYDSRNNIVQSNWAPKPNSNLATFSTTRIYPPSCSSATQATCNLPLSVTDARSNTTEFTYNSRGQVETERGPAPSVGAARPLTTYTYTLRTARIRDASGAVTDAGPPISLLTKTSVCRTVSPCAGTSDEVVTEYDYGPTTGLNTLRLRGLSVTAANASGQFETLRTCYGYNYFGERISETSPNAQLASCP